jgi:hypothetical protein
MARTVYDGFQKLLVDLEPDQREVTARLSHRRTIEQGLRAEFSSFNKVEVIGSHTRGSAITTLSDVDYLAVLGKDDVTWGGYRVQSSTTLDRVRKAMEFRFPSTQIWTRGPAVVVGFGQGQGAVDVVPAVWVGTTHLDGYPVYEIPDGEGGWMRTAPQRHAKYLKEKDENSGFKLSKTIKLLKAWKYGRKPKVPVLGFHMELLLSSESICSGARSYQHCLLDSFRKLRDRGGVALNDPLAIANRVPVAGTQTQAQEVVTHANYAAEKAVAAIQNEVAGKVDDAFYYWKLVFPGSFPSRR